MFVLTAIIIALIAFRAGMLWQKFMEDDMNQLIAIDANALADLRQEVSRLHARLDAVQMTPRPEWVTIDEFAAMIGRSPRTVKRRIQDGALEAKEVAGVRMVRVNLGA